MGAIFSRRKKKIIIKCDRCQLKADMPSKIIVDECHFNAGDGVTYTDINCFLICKQCHDELGTLPYNINGSSYYKKDYCRIQYGHYFRYYSLDTYWKWLGSIN